MTSVDKFEGAGVTVWTVLNGRVNKLTHPAAYLVWKIVLNYGPKYFLTAYLHVGKMLVELICQLESLWNKFKLKTEEL